jgi:hypothetical protein
MMDECQRDKLIFSLFVRMNIVLAARRAAIKKKDVRMPLFAARTALAKVCVCAPTSHAVLLPLTSPKASRSLVAFSPRKNTRDPLYFLRGGGTFDVFTLRCWFVALRR